WIGKKLSEIGVALEKVVTIGDEKREIESTVDAAVRDYEVTIVTGGLGPTHDDITKKTVVDYFGGKLVFHEEILIRLKEFFEARGYKMPANNEGQAWLPDNAEILPNKVGSAQGMLFRKNGNICYVLPGVPREMNYIMENSVLPYLQQQARDSVILHYTWRTTGVPESKLAEMLDNLEEIGNYGKLAFLPKYTGVDLRISIAAKSRAEADNRRRAAEQLILDKAGKFVYATGNVPLEKIVGDLLRERKKTLAVAESCTGGLICHQITSIAGSSDYFMGGMITYCNDQKIKALGVSELTLEKYGAVSEEIASEMAAGVRERVGTDYGLSVTGIAGPGGGTEEKPVGLVYIGLATNSHDRAKKFLFARDRAINQERSAAAALLMLLLELKGSM
ncbi:MAG: competence/damage-inducible protein A, partial [bacterium]